jgi:hypothetical protein
MADYPPDIYLEWAQGGLFMKTTTTVMQWLIRITGLIQIVLGTFIWTGNADALIPVHIASGSVLVLALAALAVLAARAGVQLGYVALAIGWALVLLILGLTQEQLLPDSGHWVIQVLHVLLGLGAIGLAEYLAAQIKGRKPTTSGPKQLVRQ